MMKEELDFPWARYGLIADLAFRFQAQSTQFGKTALMKMIYLLQELYGLPCGYEFTFYTYGPFSMDVLNDLDIVESLRGVEVEDVNAGAGGYEILPGSKNEFVREKAKDFLAGAKETLDRLIQEFGTFNAKELELRSTIIYADRDTRRHGKRMERANFIKLIKEIKPWFDQETIDAAYSELEAKGYVETRY